MNSLPDAPVCERANDLIAFLYSEIDEPDARDFERHLLNCAECESELRAFKQVQSSVVAWRQEALGGATANSVAVSPAVHRASDPGQPSAIAAIRQFFKLSPLWLKGSIAFASVLFCLLSAVALAHLFEKPRPVVVSDEIRYPDKELKPKIEEAVKSRDLEAPTPLPTKPDHIEQARDHKRVNKQSSERVAVNPKVRRGPLTKSEREQLAADLRLTAPQDDTDLDLLGDGNQ